VRGGSTLADLLLLLLLTHAVVLGPSSKIAAINASLLQINRRCADVRQRSSASSKSGRLAAAHMQCCGLAAAAMALSRSLLAVRLLGDIRLQYFVLALLFCTGRRCELLNQAMLTLAQLRASSSQASISRAGCAGCSGVGILRAWQWRVSHMRCCSAMSTQYAIEHCALHCRFCIATTGGSMVGLRRFDGAGQVGSVRYQQCLASALNLTGHDCCRNSMRYAQTPNLSYDLERHVCFGGRSGRRQLAK
jgi:hypothetical protein